MLLIFTTLTFGLFLPLTFSPMVSCPPLFCYCFHGFQLPSCWYFQTSLHLHILFSLSLSLSCCHYLGLPHLISLFYIFQSFMFKASLFFTLVLSRVLFHHVPPLSATSSFILQPFTDFSVLSLVFSSGGVSWEGQLIYPPKKGTNTSCSGVCRGR